MYLEALVEWKCKAAVNGTTQVKYKYLEMALKYCKCTFLHSNAYFLKKT